MRNAVKTMTTAEVAARFHALAQAEKWFEIQDELFAENVRSIEPAHAVHMQNAQGKSAVRKKGEDFIAQVEAAHERRTTPPMVSANHFVVNRYVDITVYGRGRIQIDELMLYEVKDGLIVLEQFFY